MHITEIDMYEIIYIVSTQISAIEHDIIEVDPDTKEMLKVLVSDNLTFLSPDYIFCCVMHGCLHLTLEI